MMVITMRIMMAGRILPILTRLRAGLKVRFEASRFDWKSFNAKTRLQTEREALHQPGGYGDRPPKLMIGIHYNNRTSRTNRLKQFG